jgi:hypothetical protein
MSVSSLYILPEFLDDRGENVVNRVKQHSNMKLLTVAQDFELHPRLERLGLSDNQSLNMYDYLQGALDFPSRGIDYDMRVLPRYDKRETILSPVDRGDDHYTSVMSMGQQVGKINYLPGYTMRTKSVELFDQNHVKWAEDFYDARGFLSRRRYFNPDGKMGIELVYHVDGTPVLEISHMADKTMYRLLGTHGLPNWLLRNELSLMLWWYGRIANDYGSVYNDDPYLDPVWTQLEDRVALTEVAHIQSTDPDRVKELRNRNDVIAVNQHVADVYKFKYVNPWKTGSAVEQSDFYSPIRVAGVGVWANDTVVMQLINQIRGILKRVPAAKIHLIGYFTTASEKTYKQLVDKYKLDSHIKMHGNLVGKNRARVLKQCALAWWLPLGDESTIKASLLNHYGLPVVTTVDGFRGAIISKPTPELVAQGIELGLHNLKSWRKDVVDNPV